MRALIVLGGDAPDLAWLGQAARAADLVVCADKGALYADQAGIRPQVLIGDMDSLPGDVLGGRVATEHLLGKGCKRVALINGQQGVDAARDRLKGYRQALASNDMPFDPALVKPGNWEPSSGYEMTKELMALDEPPDGIFCANDMMAVGCYDALRELGKRVPRDVAVIGFDDREIAQYMHPPLTTLVLPLYEMGRTAVELLLDEAGGLRQGDVITRLNGSPATSLALSALQLSGKVGDQVPVEYVRDGQQAPATITLAEQP